MVSEKYDSTVLLKNIKIYLSIMVLPLIYNSVSINFVLILTIYQTVTLNVRLLIPIYCQILLPSSNSTTACGPKTNPQSFINRIKPKPTIVPYQNMYILSTQVMKGDYSTIILLHERILCKGALHFLGPLIDHTSIH